MCNPTSQDYFGSSRIADDGFESGDRLLRHCRTPVQIVPCPKNGKRISDQAFKHKPTELGTSVDLECLLLRDGLPADHRYGLMPNTFALLAVTTEHARSIANGVAWTPKPEEPLLDGAAALPNKWHGEIIGKITGGMSRQLVRVASIVRSDIVQVPVEISA